MKTLRILTI
jgi:hypothetical protein